MDNRPVLLIAVDFGEPMESTLLHGAQLARLLDADVVVVHAVEYVPYSPYAAYIEGGRDIILQLTKEKLEAAAATVSEAGANVIGTELIEGRAYDVILRLADELDTTALVIGAGKKDAMDRLILGTTAENLIRGATYPVFVHHPDDNVVDIKTIGCAVDYSDHSKLTLQTTLDLADWLRAEVVIMHAVPPPHVYPELLDNSYTAPFDLPLPDAVTQIHTELSPDAALKEALDGAESHLRQYVGGFDLTGITWRPKIIVGKPSDHIADAAREEKLDLLVIGSKGHGGLLSRLLGGTATRVIRDAPCSLLIVEHVDLFTEQEE
jgi:nucleotide-binding universal stress UspA family protein